MLGLYDEIPSIVRKLFFSPLSIFGPNQGSLGVLKKHFNLYLWRRVKEDKNHIFDVCT